MSFDALKNNFRLSLKEISKLLCFFLMLIVMVADKVCVNPRIEESSIVHILISKHRQKMY